jgi:hypothetical protein
MCTAQKAKAPAEDASGSPSELHKKTGYVFAPKHLHKQKSVINL